MMARITHFTAFYSYKGGVGRTLLLVNVGAALAQKGQKVLLWDLDLEAPGMHRIRDLAPVKMPNAGFLDWMLIWQNEGAPDEPGEDLLEKLCRSIQPVPIQKGLFILPALGKKSEGSDLYQQIRWNDIMVDDPGRGIRLFRHLLAGLSRHGAYDHILMDSRTGITDLGGLMTAVLPHAAILVGSYGSQNLSGLLNVYRALQPAADGRLHARGALSPLQRVVVVSPVPGDQEDRRSARRAVWDREFPLGGDEIRVEIPFDSRLLFIEELLSLSDPEAPVSRGYRQIAQTVESFREILRSAEAEENRKAAEHPENLPLDLKDKRIRKGQSFEDRTARLLGLLGYRVEAEQYIDGNRVDLVAYKEGGLRPECYLVECKDHTALLPKSVVEKLKVWLDAKEARSMRAEGMVVARRFSPAALTLAKASGILAYTPEALENSLFNFEHYLSQIKRNFESSGLERTYVPQKVLLEVPKDQRRGVDLLNHAVQWAVGSGRRLWLLLGDYGTGKSTFFKRLAYELALRCREPVSGQASAPIPVAIDLKRFPNAVSLETLLQEHFREYANWHGNPDIFLHLLAAGRIVLLLDAFDEMGMAAVGRKIEDQFRMLARPTMEKGEPTGNRVLLTCRTHFFRDQQNIKDVCHGACDDLVPEDSPLGKVARSFDAAIDELMLFDDAQIRQFLRNHLPEEKADEAERFIHDTYDLPRLAPRPVLLEMIVQTLLLLMSDDREVTPAGLYHRYTSLWLEERAGGQLQTTTRQRKQLLERLAFELWDSAQNRIHHRDLSRILEKLPSAERNGIDYDRIDLELRTAAFLIRSSDGYYSFSHKSFREFFFARCLLRAVEEGSGNLARFLATASLSPECIDFLMDLAQTDSQRSALQKAVKAILAAPYQPRASENALRTAYHGARHLLREVTKKDSGKTESLFVHMRPWMPTKAQLRGASLPGENFTGAWLQGADLTGADCSNAIFSGTNLSKANLSGAILRKADLQNVQAGSGIFVKADLYKVNARHGDFQRADFSGADLTAVVFTCSRCCKACFNEATLYAARLADADLTDCIWEKSDLSYITGPRSSGVPAGHVIPTDLVAVLQISDTGGVQSVVLSKDEERLLAAGPDGTAWIWDAKSSEELVRFEGHAGLVRSAVFSSDEERVLTAGRDGTARIWDARSAQEIARFKGHSGEIQTAVFSKDDERVLTAGRDGTARIWDVRSAQEIAQFKGHAGMVNSAVFSCDGQRVLTAGADSTARIWDARSAQEIAQFKGHTGTVNSAVFSCDGQRLLTAGVDGIVRIWDARSAREIAQFKGHDGEVQSATFSGNKKYVLTAGNDGTARIWDAKSTKEITQLIGHYKTVRSAFFLKYEKRICTLGFDGTVRIWDTKSAQEVAQFEGNSEWLLSGWVQSAIFSRDENSVYTVGFDGTVRIWDAKGTKAIVQFEYHAKWLQSAVFSRDNQRVLTADHDTARIWDIKSSQSIAQFKGHAEWIRSAVFSKDEKCILTAGSDGTARIWDAKSAQEIVQFKGHAGGANSAVFSKDEKCILTAGSDGTARIWDAKNAQEIAQFKGHGKGVLTARVRSAVFSRDEKRVLTAGSDGTARIWDVKTSRQIAEFKGHEGEVRSAVFSRDGKLVLTAGEDGTVRTWDAKKAQEIIQFMGHSGTVNSAVFSEDEKRLLTAGSDGTARIWDVNTGKELFIFISPLSGWLSLDHRGHYRGDAQGLRYLCYKDRNELSLRPTLWYAEDLPEMAAP